MQPTPLLLDMRPAVGVGETTLPSPALWLEIIPPSGAIGVWTPRPGPIWVQVPDGLLRLTLFPSPNRYRVRYYTSGGRRPLRQETWLVGPKPLPQALCLRAEPEGDPVPFPVWAVLQHPFPGASWWWADGLLHWQNGPNPGQHYQIVVQPALAYADVFPEPA